MAAVTEPIPQRAGGEGGGSRNPRGRTDFTARRETGGRRRPRGYDLEWSPQAATRELLAHVDEVLDEYAEHLPLTVRQVFYRLVAGGVIDKTERAYSNLAEHLVRARRAKRISFDSIRDDGEVIYSAEFHDGPEGFFDATARRLRNYRRDRQAGQAQRLELWCEAAGMAPQLVRVADVYSVPVFSSGGFASLTTVRRIADRALRNDVPTVLLHVGDLDPSGESIFASLAQDAAAFVEADRVIQPQRVEAVRVALTSEQVVDYGLPTAAAKTSDRRSRRWRGGTCQVEALAPDELAATVEQAITKYLSKDIFEAQLEQERGDRQEIALGLPAGSA